MTNTLNERIKHARKNAHLTQKELANKVGITKAAVQRLENGSSASSKKTVSIALACGVDPIWLETGRGKIALPGSAYSMNESGEGGRTVRTCSLLTRIPLISWDELAKFCDYSRKSVKLKVASWVPVAPKVSECSFALKVPDDSMEPEFREGEIIIIDPMMIVSHNQYLVARERQNRPTFKRLIHYGDKQYLKPLNDRCPLVEVEGDLHAYGVVVCKYKEYQ